MDGKAGRNPVQVQRWLGHHSPSFTLDTYVHLLEADLGEPLMAQTCVQPSVPGTDADANKVRTDPTPLDATPSLALVPGTV